MMIQDKVEFCKPPQFNVHLKAKKVLSDCVEKCDAGVC